MELYMKIKLNSIIVNDQKKALDFYTQILGFKKKMDINLGEYRWLTVVSEEEQEGTELVLEPNSNPASIAYQKSLYEQNIPITAFEVESIKKEHKKLQSLGVIFINEPMDVGTAILAVFDDTCGNFIQIYEKKD